MNPQYMSFGGPQPGFQANRPPGQQLPGQPPQQGSFQNIPLRPGAPTPNQFMPPAGGIRAPMSQLPPSQLPPSQLPPTSINGMQNGQDKQGSPKTMPPNMQGILSPGNQELHMPPTSMSDHVEPNMPQMQNQNITGVNNNAPPNLNQQNANMTPPTSQNNLNSSPTMLGRPPSGVMPENKQAMPPMSNANLQQQTPPMSNQSTMPPMPGQNIPRMSAGTGPNVQSSTPQSTLASNMPLMPGQNMPQAPGQQLGPPHSTSNILPPQGVKLPPLPSQNLPPQGQHSMPSISQPIGQNAPPQGFGQGMAPPMNQNMPPQMGQNMPPPMGHNIPPQSGSNIPSSMGQNVAPSMGQNMPPSMGQNMPPSMGQNMPPSMGQNMPPSMGQNTHPPTGKNMPQPMGGQNMPPSMGNNMPPHMGQNNAPNMSQGMPPPMGQNLPPQMGQNAPPSLGQNMPPMPPHNPAMMQKRPPMPTQIGGFNNFNQPPMPGQPQPQLQGQYGQMNNQMQNMNISGPYSPKSLNGDNGPHMPPPLNQQPGYMNGQQNRAGYPPMPNQGVAPNQYQQGAYAQQQQQQQQQQRRLNPDQMPSPIQVIQDDKANRSGIFYSNQKGVVPPLVSTKFVVQDQGYASPRYLRSTMYNVPITNELIKQTSVPFGLLISPMARIADGEYPPPIVNFGELGPVRCIRCKAYMCPYMQFIDSGRRFQCLFCKASTDVPAEYFQHLDHTGQRMDRYERPELVLGTYEFTATKDYCRNNTFPKPPGIIFVIDVSYNNIKSGLVSLICSQMKDIIQNLPIDEGQEKSNMKVGFITYNSTVHFYNIKGNLAAPQMLVVGDTQEMFMPLLDGFLCTPEESEPVIDALMEQIPQMFADTRECETILLPAIVAGMEALKASDCTGKLLVFHSTLPIAEAPGKLKARDDRKLLGTEKERTVLTPQNQAYNQLGQDCVGVGCSVDLFLFNNAYIDIATIGQVARLTGGEVYKYTYFQADLDGQRLIYDIVTNINRPVAFDAVMRVRTSTGVRPTDFYGHCYMSNTTDMELAAIDCDKAIAVEVKHDDKLQDDDGIYIQVALLYTSVSGQRRLRIINQVLKTCSQMADLYRSCDLETIINFFSKQSVHKILDNNPKAVKDSIVQRAAQTLATYRKNCASPSSAGQLILPECMKLLPLYVNCLLKSDALSGASDITVDDRSFNMMAVMMMDLPNSANYFYPRLIPLHEIEINGDEPVEIPMQIRCTIEKMTDQGVYILENGIYMFLWVGLGANQEFVQQVFDVPSAVHINIEQTTLPTLSNPMSEAVRNIIEQIRSQRHRYMRLTLVRQKEKMESVFKHFLVEDRGLDGSPGYVDFLCHMHKEIRNILS